MADSRQLDILKRLTAHLQGITPDSGYEFDLSENVFRGRSTYGEETPSPLISINEHLSGDIDVALAGLNNIERKETWVLLLEGSIPYEGDNPTDVVYQLKAAVEKRLSDLIKMDPQTGGPAYPDVYHLGITDTIIDMAIGPGVVSTSHRDASSKAFFYLPVGITWALDVSDPFVED